MALTRKAFLARASALTLATAVGMLAQGEEVLAAAAAPQLRQLRRVGKIATRSATALAKVRAGWQAPPDPEKPAITAELNAIIASADRIRADAQALLATLR